MGITKKLIQTHVYTDDGVFFVSTIDRDSSAMMGGRYAETMAWEWDEGKRARGGLLMQGEDMEGSIRRHMQIVESLHTHGIAATKEQGE